MIIRTFTSIVFFLCILPLSAQTFWTPAKESNWAAKGKQLIFPQKYRTIQIDIAAANNLLAAAVSKKKIINLPMPDGTSARFLMEETPVMPASLQARYPQIRCFTGKGIDDPSSLVKCDLTPQGFHGMILSAHHSAVFIDPFSTESPDMGIVYFKSDYTAKNTAQPFACGAGADHIISKPDSKTNGQPEFQGDCAKRRFRLALACTGEYATFHGGTKALALAAMNTSLNRVNGVYEREINVTFQLVAKNDTLIFLNGNSDPYTNDDGAAQLDENEAVCNARIGIANYDIGHVFSTDGGGIAGLGVVCTTGKAWGATGSPMPIGDPFDIDYVVHELGHQFDATHTQNNDCNSSTLSSMEPGSGSTIMGYAGICDPNVQNFGEDYFHAISIEQIGRFLTLGLGSTCGTKTNTVNHAPTVNAGANYTIPRSTPFELTAIAEDADSDPLTYCWEQMDPETATMPPAASNTIGPLFRSFYPTTNPVRTFPRLQDLTNNITPVWEKLPGVARSMKFRVTARDNQCTGEDDMAITVASNSGPFTVTAPNTTTVTWPVGTTQTVTWNVSGTTGAPVSCANVRIRLSTDAGLTYPIVLANSVPNNGSAAIVVPNFISNTCRVKVEGLGNIFFDISNQNFKTVAATTPTFTTSVTPLDNVNCVGNTSNFVLSVASVLGFGDPVSVSVTGAPTGATVSVTPAVMTPPGNVSISVTGTTNANAGAYNLNIAATSGTTVRNTTALLTIQAGMPTAAPSITAPADGATSMPTAVTLDWSSVPFASTYLVEIATSPTFSPASIVRTRIATTDSVMNVALSFSTVYYWRVKGQNNCGSGPYSNVFTFQTTGATCGHVFNSIDVPKNINADIASLANSTLNVSAVESIADINVSLQIDHTWVGDLNARLIAPNGTQITLFDRPGYPGNIIGCDGENLIVTFDDETATGSDIFENTCNTNPAISGTFKPLQALSLLRNVATLGNWRLSVQDFESGDGGSINAWSISVCYAVSIPAGVILNNKLTDVSRNSFATIDSSKLKMAAHGQISQIVYTLLSLPANGAVQKNGQVLAIGDFFTQTDINTGLIRYVHNGNAATADAFRFDAFDDSNDAWVHNAQFNLRILTNDLAATITQTGNILCNGQSTGAITVNATGLNGQYQYALNGGTPQSSNVFTNLAAGTYTVVVSGQFGYSATAGPFTISSPGAVQLTTNLSVDDLTVSATGGTGAFTFSIGQGFQPNGTFENLANGTYTITARDANGCTASTQVVVAVNTLLAGLAVTQQPQCNNESTGIITATVGGGQPPFTYRLNTGQEQSSNIFSNLPAGNYFILVRDAQGFETTTTTVQLINPPALTLLTNVTLNVATLSGSGGTGTLQYSIDGTHFQSSGTFNNLENGNYTATVRDANGCLATASFSVNVAPLSQVLSITTPVLCNGSNTGAISATASGGIAPYQFKLNNGDYQSSNQFTGLSAGNYTVTVLDAREKTFTSMIELMQPSPINVVASAVLNTITISASGGTGTIQYSLDGTNFQAINTFTAVSNGTYTVVVRDANNCTATTSATVNIAALAVTAAVQQPILCNGQSTGQISITGSGGVPPYQYSLNGGAYQNNNLFSNLSAGNYSLVVRDNSGSTASNLLALVQPGAVVLSLTANFNTITASTMGGSGAYQYSLNGAAFQPAGTFSNLVNGTYTVIAKDGNGCTGSATANINVAALNANASITKSLLCAGDANASFSVAASGGVPPYQYSLNNSVFQSNNNFGNLNAGNYTLIVRDDSGNTVTNTISITQPPAITATATSVLNTVTVAATGGTGTLNYSLNNGSFQASNIFNDVPNGTFSVMVRDANGCTASTTVVVNITALSNTVAISQPISCHEGSNGAIIANTTGGVPPYQYSINGGNFLNVNIFTGLMEGSYTITVKDAAGNTTSQSIQLVAPPAIAATATVTFNTVTIHATGGTGTLQYSLNGTNFQMSSLFNGVANGTYTATVRDANGCTATTMAIVNVVPLASESVITQAVTCFGNANGAIRVSAAGGIPPYEFSLNGGAYQSSNQFANLSAGEKNISVRDAAGTIVSNTLTLTEPAPLSIQATANQNNITVVAFGGTQPYSFSINNNPWPGPNTANLPNGTYTVVGTDANGCTATTSVTIMLIGVDDLVADWRISLSPNPGNGLFNLSIEESPAIVWIQVLDISGKLLERLQCTPVNGLMTQSIDLRNQPAGMYLLWLTDGVKAGSLKLIKEE